MRCDVSVIIPAYNSGVCIVRCLESISTQTADPKEIIVVDDGSTDNTRTIVDRYNGNLTYVKQGNAGPSSARNAGMQQANTEYIAFLDADDYWEPEFLESCTGFLSEHAEAVAVSTATKAVGWDGKISIVPRSLEMLSHPEELRPRCLDNFFAFWAQHDHVRTGSVVIRRSAVGAIDGFRSEFPVAEDLEYWGLIATCGPWGFIPQPLFVTDGTETAVTHGWLAKLRKRGRRCPPVEIWEERIAPRLKDSERASFQIVRGRVALNFAYIKLLAGLREDARHVVLKYGSDFPHNSMASLLRRCAPSTSLWYGCCQSLLLREVWKDICLRKRFGGAS